MMYSNRAIFDDPLGDRIRAMTDAAVLGRDANDVVRAVLAAPLKGHRVTLFQLRILGAGATLALVAVIVMTALRLGGPESASQPASAQVRGLTYGTSVVRNLNLDDANLTPIADADQNGGLLTIGRTAYQVDFIDPGQVLVMKLAPGQADDAGSIGKYLLLVRGNGFTLMCGYFSPDDALRPTVCR